MKMEADLHVHTIASGHGYSTIKEIVESAREKELKMVAITDHGLQMPGAPHWYHFTNMKSLPRIIQGVEVLRGVEANILDVLIGLYHEIAASSNLGGENADPLQIVLQTNRKEEVEKVKEDLLTGKITAMLLRFTLWLNENAFVPKARKMKLKKFTIKRLQKWIGRMQEMGGELDTKTMPELHQLRITGKKVRYAIEGLKLDRNDRVLKNFKMLQDDLGNIHDAAVQAEALEKLISNHTGKIMHRNMGILIGWTARMKYESQQKLNKDWAVFCHNINLWQKHVEK